MVLPGARTCDCRHDGAHGFRCATAPQMAGPRRPCREYCVRILACYSERQVERELPVYGRAASSLRSESNGVETPSAQTPESAPSVISSNCRGWTRRCEINLWLMD